MKFFFFFTNLNHLYLQMFQASKWLRISSENLQFHSFIFQLFQFLFRWDIWKVIPYFNATSHPNKADPRLNSKNVCLELVSHFSYRTVSHL